jgi:hypothetical protein
LSISGHPVGRSVYRGLRLRRLWISPFSDHAPLVLSGEQFRFRLELEFNVEQEPGFGKGVSEGRWLEAAVIEPFPYFLSSSR